MEGNRPTKAMGELPQVVDTVAMIGMIVRDDDVVDFSDIGLKQLVPQVGPAIDQEPLSFAVDQDRGSGAPVPRLGRVAVTPVVADAGHPG